jgi:hypothetical protein
VGEVIEERYRPKVNIDRFIGAHLLSRSCGSRRISFQCGDWVPKPPDEVAAYFEVGRPPIGRAVIQVREIETERDAIAAKRIACAPSVIEVSKVPVDWVNGRAVPIQKHVAFLASTRDDCCAAIRELPTADHQIRRSCATRSRRVAKK